MTEHTQAAQGGDALIEMAARKDAAYEERNRVVAALASAYPSGTARTAIEGWSEDWHGCVYIDLPTGQASWHYHDSHAHLFAHLPPYAGTWDGHSTPEKYERLSGLAALAAPSREPAEPFCWVPVWTGASGELHPDWNWATIHREVVERDFPAMSRRGMTTLPLYAAPQPSAQAPAVATEATRCKTCGEVSDIPSALHECPGPIWAAMTEPTLNYAPLQEFAGKHRVPYNELCAAVRTALALPPAAPYDPIVVPRGLIGAACSAIDKKRYAPKTLAELRRYTVGDLSGATEHLHAFLDAAAALRAVDNAIDAADALLPGCDRVWTHWATGKESERTRVGILRKTPTGQLVVTRRGVEERFRWDKYAGAYRAKPAGYYAGSITLQNVPPEFLP